MRLFVALDLPGDVRVEILELIARCKPACRGAKWVRSEGMHVTLKFIGHAIADGDAEGLAAVRTVLGTVKSAAPVEMRYRGIGFFPNSRNPSVFWAGIQPSPNLAKLVADIEQTLKPLGIPPEDRPFVPHLTLARFKSPEGVKQLAIEAQACAEREFGSSREREFHLFESKLKPGGAEHTKIESYAFVERPA